MNWILTEMLNQQLKQPQVQSRYVDDIFCISHRPGALLFNAGCNEQVFSPKP